MGKLSAKQKASRVLGGFTWFPFDVIDWLTSPDVAAMASSEEGLYIRLLAVQWRDGYLLNDPQLLGKQCAREVRLVTRWLAKWGHLFPISPANPLYLRNEKLHEIAVAVAKSGVDRHAEEKRVQEIREEDTENTTSEEVSEGGEVSEVSESRVGLTPSSALTIKPLSPLTPKEEKLLEAIMPSCIDQENYKNDLHLILFLTEAMGVDSLDLLKFNRTHKPQKSALYIRTPAQFLKAVSGKDAEFRMVNDYKTHIMATCPICKSMPYSVRPSGYKAEAEEEPVGRTFDVEEA